MFTPLYFVVFVPSLVLYWSKWKLPIVLRLPIPVVFTAIMIKLILWICLGYIKGQNGNVFLHCLLVMWEDTFMLGPPMIEIAYQPNTSFKDRSLNHLLNHSLALCLLTVLISISSFDCDLVIRSSFHIYKGLLSLAIVRKFLSLQYLLFIHLA